jgi:hypothetical protein
VLTAHVWYELDKWGLNCFVAVLRQFLTVAKVDLGNLPNRGDVDGAGVTWLLIDGGYNVDVKVVDQASADEAKASAIVMFDPGSGFDGLHNLVNQMTKGGGKAIVPVVGLPQHKDLSRSKVVAIDKTYSVAIEVKFKGADPEKFLSELVDVLGPALGVSSGDILGGLVSGFTEMLYRMSWRVGQVFVFPLTDWQECDGGWVGTFHIRRTRNASSTTPRPEGTETVSDDLMDASDWAFVGNSKDRPAEVEATWSANFKQNTRDATDAGGTHDVDERKSVGSGRGKCTWQIYDANDSLVFAPGESDLWNVSCHRHRVLGSSRPVVTTIRISRRTLRTACLQVLRVAGNVQPLPRIWIIFRIP